MEEDHSLQTNPDSYHFNGESVASILQRTKLREESVDPFSVLPGSNIRPIQKASVERLKKSMMEKGFLSTSAIIVNEIETLNGEKQFRCIEGLHRIEALKLIVNTYAYKNVHLADPFRKVNVHVHQVMSAEVELLVAMALNDEKDVVAKQTFFTRMFFLQRRAEVMSEEEYRKIVHSDFSGRLRGRQSQFSYRGPAFYSVLCHEGFPMGSKSFVKFIALVNWITCKTWEAMTERSVQSGDYDIFQRKHVESIRLKMNQVLIHSGGGSSRKTKGSETWNSKFPKLSAAEYQLQFQDFTMARYVALCDGNSAGGKKPEQLDALILKACQLGYVVLREFYFFMCKLESLMKECHVEGPTGFSMEGKESILNNLLAEERETLMKVVFDRADDDVLFRSFFPETGAVLWQPSTKSLILGLLEVKLTARLEALQEEAMKQKRQEAKKDGMEEMENEANISVAVDEPIEAPGRELVKEAKGEVEAPEPTTARESRPKRSATPPQRLAYLRGVPTEKKPRFTSKRGKSPSGSAVEAGDFQTAVQLSDLTGLDLGFLRDPSNFDKEMSFLNGAHIAGYNLDWMAWFSASSKAVSGIFPFEIRDPIHLYGQAKIILVDPPFSIAKEALKAILRAIPLLLAKNGVALFFTTFSQFGSLMNLVREMCGPATENGLPVLVAEDVPLLVEEDAQRISRRKKLQVFQEYKAGFLNGMAK
jgi:hypothetical protein